jgi:hypothetical protein
MNWIVVTDEEQDTSKCLSGYKEEFSYSLFRMCVEEKETYY